MPALNAAFFDAVRPLFGGSLSQAQVDGISIIVKAFDERGDGDLKHLAYLLGTTKHETADTMAPIYERGAKAYFNKYEPGTKIGKALGNTAKGDGYRYRGRGFVQLTGRANYRKFGIEDNPDKALEPDIAAIKVHAEGSGRSAAQGSRIEPQDVLRRGGDSLHCDIRAE